MVSTPVEGLGLSSRPAEEIPATGTHAGQGLTPQGEPLNYLNATTGIRSWLFTLDHKRIAMLYLLTVSLMFIVGGAAAGMVRIDLLDPQGFLISPRNLQQNVFGARHRYGVFLHHSGDSGNSRQLFRADDDRR